MVAVLADHLAAVLQGLGLPGRAAGKALARHLHKGKQTQLVAGVQKGRAGRAAAPHRVAAQLLFQDLRVQPLEAVGHGVALVGPALGAHQAAQLGADAVQVQPAGHELQRAEPEANHLLVQHPVGQAAGAGPDQPDGQSVQGGVLAAPGLDPVQGAADGQGQLAHIGGPPPRGGADLGLQRAAHRLALGGGIDAERPVHPRLDEHIPQPGVFFHVQADPAVQPAVGQGLGLAAKGRDVQGLAAVAADGQDVFFPQADRPGQVDGKGGVPAGVVAHPLAVAVDGGLMGRRPKGQQQGAALPAFGRSEHPPVAADQLIVVFVAVVKGQRFDGVGQADRLQGQAAGGLQQGRGELRGERPAVVPVKMFGAFHLAFAPPCPGRTGFYIINQSYSSTKI